MLETFTFQISWTEIFAIGMAVGACLCTVIRYILEKLN